MSEERLLRIECDEWNEVVSVINMFNTGLKCYGLKIEDSDDGEDGGSTSYTLRIVPLPYLTVNKMDWKIIEGGVAK